MIVLYLLAAHMVGDFLLQTRWQADPETGKLRDPLLRLRHVGAYCLPFVPIGLVYAHWGKADRLAATAVFLVFLSGAHFLTDSRRFLSTPGEWIAWNFLGADPTPAEKRGVHAAMGADTTQFDLGPNPWAPMPILIDQALHLVQLAVLGGIFLS